MSLVSSQRFPQGAATQTQASPCALCVTAIRAFPTFRFYHNGQLLEEVGALQAAVLCKRSAGSMCLGSPADGAYLHGL